MPAIGLSTVSSGCHSHRQQHQHQYSWRMMVSGGCASGGHDVNINCRSTCMGGLYCLLLNRLFRSVGLLYPRDMGTRGSRESAPPEQYWLWWSASVLGCGDESLNCSWSVQLAIHWLPIRLQLNIDTRQLIGGCGSSWMKSIPIWICFCA